MGVLAPYRLLNVCQGPTGLLWNVEPTTLCSLTRRKVFKPRETRPLQTYQVVSAQPLWRQVPFRRV